MTKEQIIKKLEILYNELDFIQETDLLQSQNSEDEDTAMWNIGEALGCIENAIDILIEE